LHWYSIWIRLSVKIKMDKPDLFLVVSSGKNFACLKIILDLFYTRTYKLNGGSGLASLVFPRINWCTFKPPHKKYTNFYVLSQILHERCTE